MKHKIKFTIYGLSSSASPENIRYIGCTHRELKLRLKEHIQESHYRNEPNKKTHKENWIQKELKLKNNILITEIEKNISISKVEKTEVKNIKYYKSLGYKLTNATSGGIINRTVSNETKNRIRKARLGTKSSQETKDKLRAAGFLRINSEKTRQKMSRGISGKTRGKKLTNDRVKNLRENAKDKKPVLKYDKNGKFVCEYQSIKEAKRDTGTLENSIAACCNKDTKYRSAGGFIWKFKKQDTEIEKEIEPYYNVKYTKTILQYDKDLKLINEWPNALEAERKTGIFSSNIGMCCKEKYKHAGGFIWKYKDKNKPIIEKNGPLKKIPVYQYTFKNKKIAEYNSISDAVKATNGHRSHISECCKGKVRSSGGFIWKFKTKF